MISKYTFTDISVFSRVGFNEYVNISDYDITETTCERYTFKSCSQYVIMLHAFAYERYMLNKEVYICDVTAEELMTLAGVTNKRFIDGFGANEDILVLLCAKKIMDYKYGEIKRVSAKECLQLNTYNFCRMANVNVNTSKSGYKYVKRHIPVLTKTFYKAC